MSANEWDDYASDWDGNPQAVQYASNAFAALSASLDIAGFRVLDFGCGTGLLAERLSPNVNTIVALDGSRRMVEMLQAKELANVTAIASFLSEDLLRTETALQQKFDLIVASSVCAFLPDYPGTLRLLHRLLKTGGSFVQWDWLVSNGASSPGFTEADLQAALSQAGLSKPTLSRPFEIEGRPVVMARAMV